VVIKELGDDEDEEDEEEEEEEEEEAVPVAAARGKGAAKGGAADHTKDFLSLSGDGKKRGAAAAPAAAPPAKKAAAAPAAAAKPAAKPAAAAAPSPAAAAKAGKPGSQFADGPAGSLGSRKFDNGLEIVNISNGKPDGKVALMGKRCACMHTAPTLLCLWLITCLRWLTCALAVPALRQRANEVRGPPQVQRQGV
jgi:hypothetical protein